MRIWNLREGDPLSLFLAADARLSSPDYTDDQIWELALSGGDPPALAVETMLGLRALSLRLFPVFVVGHHPLSDPARFCRVPVIRRFAPNYIQVEATPFDGLTADCEFWAPESHALTGRITLRNAGSARIEGECWLAGILRPAGGGEAFRIESGGRAMGAFLVGRAGNLEPVVCMPGGGGGGRATYPALKAVFELEPGATREVRWAYAGRPSMEEGLALAKLVLDLPWEASIARVELAAAALMQIETGRPDWDAVLAFSQVCALQSLTGATPHLPNPSPVIGRTPDRGYSLRGDGSDYPPSWAGITPLELFPALPILASASPDLARGLLRNLLHASSPDGLPDARPGAGRQRAGGLCAPVLAQVAWRIHAGERDYGFIEEIAPALEAYAEAWFSSAHDGDGDGAPEWGRLDSLGPEPPPLWSRDERWGGWVLPSEVESPSLLGMLYGECRAMERIAAWRGGPEAARRWRERAEQVRRALDRMWSGRMYRTVDRETHQATAGKRLWNGEAQDAGRIGEKLDPPARVMVRCAGLSGTRPPFRIALAGKDAQGRACQEELRGEDFFWLRGDGAAFSKSVWSRLDSLSVESPSGLGTIRVDVADLRRDDLTAYLPLWGRAAGKDRAEKMFQRLNDENGYLTPAGLRFSPKSDPAAAAEGEGAPGLVWLLWNSLLGEAALRYGRVDLAREWIERWMRAAAEGLRTNRAFRSAYRSDGAGSMGPRNSLRGIFPVGLFLSAAGVFPMSGRRVWIGGQSVFPFAVTVRYKGLSVVREGERALIEFVTGKRKMVDGRSQVLIEDESD